MNVSLHLNSIVSVDVYYSNSVYDYHNAIYMSAVIESMDWMTKDMCRSIGHECLAFLHGSSARLTDSVISGLSDFHLPPHSLESLHDWSPLLLCSPHLARHIFTSN